jgi:hypothetical protein
MVTFRNVAKGLFNKKTVAIGVLVILAIVAVLVLMRKRKESFNLDDSSWEDRYMAEVLAKRTAEDEAKWNAAPSLQYRDRGAGQYRATELAKQCGGPSMRNWYRNTKKNPYTCCELKNDSGCPRCRDFYTNELYDATPGCTDKRTACGQWKNGVLPDKNWKFYNGYGDIKDIVDWGQNVNPHKKYALGYILKNQIISLRPGKPRDVDRDWVTTDWLRPLEALRISRGPKGDLYDRVKIFAPCA